MRLTTRGRYAVTAMLDLACYGLDRPVNLADIAARQQLSLSYLEQLFAKLRRNGLVRSVRGPGGGIFWVGRRWPFRWRTSSGPWMSRSVPPPATWPTVVANA